MSQRETICNGKEQRQACAWVCLGALGRSGKEVAAAVQLVEGPQPWAAVRAKPFSFQCWERELGAERFQLRREGAAWAGFVSLQILWVTFEGKTKPFLPLQL